MTTPLTRTIASLTGDDAIAVAALATGNGAAKSDLSNLSSVAEGAMAPIPVLARNASVGRTFAARFGDILTPKDFGAIGNGVADDTAAFLLWIAQLGTGAEGYIPPGTYNLDSATLGVNGLVCAAGTKIRGAGKASKIVLTGTASCNILSGVDVDGLDVEGVWFYGNGQASGFGLGYGIAHTLSSSATADVSGVKVRHCRFDNFKGDYWVEEVSESATHKIRGVRIENNEFYSYNGNARDSTNLGVLSGNILVNADGAGGIYDVWITDNYSDANWVKSFALLFSNIFDYHVTGNIVDNAGQGYAVPDKGAYAILSYASTGTPTRGDISNNTINAPFSCGVYAPQVDRLKVCGNTISGQTDTAAGTLLKAAIAIADANGLTVSGNILSDNYGDISVEGSHAATHAGIVITGNECTGCTGLAAIKIGPNADGDWAGLTVSGNNIYTATASCRGIGFNSSNALGVTDFKVSGNNIKADYGVDLNMNAVAGVHTTKGKVSDNRIAAAVYGVYAKAVDSVAIIDNTLIGQASGCLAYIESATAVRLLDNDFLNQATGLCVIALDAQGSTWGNVFTNCAAPLDTNATSLGHAIPTFSGGLGQMVQNMNAGTSGSAGTTFTLQGWICQGTTTWSALRLPDQNNTATA